MQSRLHVLRSVKPYGILKVKNSLEKPVYSVTAYTTCSLFIFAAGLLQDYYFYIYFLQAVIKTLCDTYVHRSLGQLRLLFLVGR